MNCFCAHPVRESWIPAHRDLPRVISFSVAAALRAVNRHEGQAYPPAQCRVKTRTIATNELNRAFVYVANQSTPHICDALRATFAYRQGIVLAAPATR